MANIVNSNPLLSQLLLVIFALAIPTTKSTIIETTIEHIRAFHDVRKINGKIGKNAPAINDMPI